MPTQPSSLVFLHYLTDVFDNLDEAILLIGVEPNETYRLLLANQAYARNTGHMENLVGKLISDFVAPETYAILCKQYKQVVTTKQPMFLTQTYKVPLGVQTFNVKFLPILNAVGEVVQIAGITQNVSELHNLRAKVRELQAELKKQ